ncbi:MAG TPA: PocR ligand-binding domain-containing protein, partial [Syntrophomonadaceae bacterium]|nr:PocR ligand-binding domain-containing protein [Syntrophomonadaceae bacterium]
MDIRDLIDLNFLQKLQDNFALSVGVGALTEDGKGNALTKPSHFTNLCMNMIRGTQIGQRRCMECGIIAGEKAALTGKPQVYHCHAGLVDFVAPIMLDGRQIGSIFGGQILTEPPDELKFSRIAAEIGVNADDFLEAVRKLPIIPIENVRAAANVLLSVADTFSKMAYQKIELQKWNRELVIANNR